MKERLEGIGIDEEKRKKKIEWDKGEVEVERELRKEMDEKMVEDGMKRILIDWKRKIDEKDIIKEIREKKIVKGKKGINKEERMERIEL